MLYFFKIYVWFFNTYDYVYYLDGIYEKNKYIQNQLRLFMHSLKYNIYIIEIIHHTLDVIYIYLLNISYLCIYICILSQSVFSILPHVIYIIFQIQYPCACFAHTWDLLQSKRFLIPTLLLTYRHV